MNWYKKAQLASDNYHALHKRGDAVWVFGANGRLEVAYPDSPDKSITHNRAFGRDGLEFLFKGRYSPDHNTVNAIPHNNFKVTNIEYAKNKLEDALYNEFGSDIKINYYY